MKYIHLILCSTLGAMAEATASGTSPGLTSSPVEVVAGEKKPATSARRDYKGFVAGVFSGIAKLTGMFVLCSSVCIKMQNYLFYPLLFCGGESLHA